MSALITSVEHALATAASDTVKVAKFVETSVLPVLKKVQADESTMVTYPSADSYGNVQTRYEILFAKLSRRDTTQSPQTIF